MKCFLFLSALMLLPFTSFAENKLKVGSYSVEAESVSPDAQLLWTDGAVFTRFLGRNLSAKGKPQILDLRISDKSRLSRDLTLADVIKVEWQNQERELVQSHRWGTSSEYVRTWNANVTQPRVIWLTFAGNHQYRRVGLNLTSGMIAFPDVPTQSYEVERNNVFKAYDVEYDDHWYSLNESPVRVLGCDSVLNDKK